MTFAHERVGRERIMGQRLILYGGTFNPVHFGHLICARAARELLEAERVLLIASPNPPHKKDVRLIDAAHRLRMLELAVDGDAELAASDAEIRRGGVSYTYDTVMHFREQAARGAELIWLIGADSLPELATWHRTEDLVRVCRIVTLRRPGWEAPDLGALRARIGAAAVEQLVADIMESPRIDISATDIRARVRAGRSIRYLVPDPVREYIEAERLYLAD